MLSDEKSKGPYFMIGHSLGGLYALHLTKHVDVAGAVILVLLLQEVGQQIGLGFFCSNISII